MDSSSQPQHDADQPNAGGVGNRRMLATLVVVTIGLGGWGMLRVRDLPMVLDETQVKAQVDLFLSGRLELLRWPGEEYPAAAMFPGFQAVLATLSAITGLHSVLVLRLFCFAFSWLYALVAYQLARQFVEPDLAILRAAQAYLLPIAFPFHFLLYTDMFSLLVTMAAFWSATCRRRHVTGVLMLSSLFVRQTNVIFAIFLWAFQLRSRQRPSMGHGSPLEARQAMVVTGDSRCSCLPASCSFTGAWDWTTRPNNRSPGPSGIWRSP